MVTKNLSAFYNESGSAFYNKSGSESSPRFITYPLLQLLVGLAGWLGSQPLAQQTLLSPSNKLMEVTGLLANLDIPSKLIKSTTMRYVCFPLPHFLGQCLPGSTNAKYICIHSRSITF